jgi:hypothetical protein
MSSGFSAGASMRFGIAILIGIGGLEVWFVFFRPADPVTLAKLKCESAVNYFTRYDVSITVVSRASVKWLSFQSILAEATSIS